MMPQQMDQTMIAKITAAGQKLMYAPQTRAFLINGLKKPGNPADKLAAEVVGIIKLLDEKARGGRAVGTGLPAQSIPPVGAALVMEAAHFAEQAGFFTTDKAMIVDAMRKTMLGLMQAFGILDQIEAAKKKAAGGAPPIPPSQPAAPPAQAAPVAPPGILQQTGGQ